MDPDFGHLNLEGLAQYNLRLVTPGGGVGALVSSNDKTSHGVVDSVPFNTALPGAPASPVYTSIQGEIMGISIGHADLYSRVLTQQWVVVTGLPDGMYWLETVIDPYDRVLETDNTNSTTRVLVDLTMPVQNPEFLLGDFNDNGVLDAGDYTVWRDNVGAGSILPNDTTPGTVDGEDLAVWQHFFADANGTNTIALPEPAGHALCLLMVTTILPRGRR